ncbi:hypothetical protein [Azospirillum sp. SYSU D00513]|uniref:hypothetical protein n=1 Tax=Azospirillum sp. SYSU D00513 TaxID=2812561 RepID=UPI001FFF459B|nr:hypothetical protein [Azospirillum sp. SYSU D00513]
MKEIVDEDLAAGHVMTDNAPAEPSARPAGRRRKASAPDPVHEEGPAPKAAKPSKAAKTAHKEAVLDDRKVVLAVEKNAEDTAPELAAATVADPTPKKPARARRTASQAMATPVLRDSAPTAPAPLPDAPETVTTALEAPADKKTTATRAKSASNRSKASKAVWTPADIKPAPERKASGTRRRVVATS